MSARTDPTVTTSRHASEAPFPLGPAAHRWLSGLCAGIIATYVVFLIVFWNRSGPRDGDQFLVFHALQYWNATLFGIAKQWTPVMCAGLSMAAEPQIPFMSLNMLLSYVSTPLEGVRMATVIYFLCGWFGAYLYAGLWLRIAAQRVLAASLFIGNGFFFCRLGFGHFDFIPFLTLPLLLWSLHQQVAVLERTTVSCVLRRRVLPTLMLGAAIGLIADGSPVAIIHLLLWVSLYAAALTFTTRSAAPLIVWTAAGLMAAVLDAGYLWPMLQGQSDFPRLTPDRFTSVFSLIWFAIVPMRGKVLPANGNGHELSVFIGPVLAYLLWRHRHYLKASLPRELARPLVLVTLVSVVLGMGSLTGIVPHWLSPFDLLRPLPGFRSIGVTGRYWGFLALPLSLLAAAALWKEAGSLPGWRLHLAMGLLVLVQLCFQSETLIGHWIHTPLYRLTPSADHFVHGPEDVTFTATQAHHHQGESLGPNQGVTNCYDMDDFTRAPMTPGGALVSSIHSTSPDRRYSAHAQFVTWSHIRVQIDCRKTDGTACEVVTAPPLRLTFQQAYHPLWRAPACTSLRSSEGNLMLECPAAQPRGTPIELEFRNPLSDTAALVSLEAWKVWLWLLSLTLLLDLIVRPRARALPRHELPSGA